MAHLHFLLGKPAHKSPVIPEVIELVQTAGHRVTHQAPRTPPEVDTQAVAEADVLVLRGLPTAVLQHLQPHADRCVNHPGATLALANRLEILGRLQEAGLPVPPTRLAHDWEAVVAAGPAGVVKAADGTRGRSAGVLLPGQPRGHTAPFPGPWLVQDAVVGDGWELKLYVLGDQVRGLRRPVAGADTAGRPPEVLSVIDDRWRHSAIEAAVALGLSVCGVDILTEPPGGVIVDVNAFPSMAAVPDAPAWVADYLTERAALSLR